MKLEDAKLWTVEPNYVQGQHHQHSGMTVTQDGFRIVLHPEAWKRVRAESDDKGIIKTIPPYEPSPKTPSEIALAAKSIERISRNPANILLPDITQLPDAPVVDEEGRMLRRCLDCGFVGNFGEITSEAHEHPDSSFRSSDYTPADIILDLFHLLDDCPHVRFWMPVSDADKHLDVWCEHSITGPKLQGFVRQNINLTTPTIHTQADADRYCSGVRKCKDLCGQHGYHLDPIEEIKLDSGPRGGYPRYLSGEVDHGERPPDFVLLSHSRHPSDARQTGLRGNWCNRILEQAQAAGVRVEEVEHE